MFGKNDKKDELIWLGQISELVNDILAKKCNMDSISNIDKYVNRCMKGKKFKIELINDAKKPFIMTVYPNYEQLKRRMPKLMDILFDIKKGEVDYINAWTEMDEWVIEIDGRLLESGNRYAVSHGDEFVGILYHELGHVMITNPIAVASAYKQRDNRVRRFEKMMMSKSLVVRQFMLPIMVHTLNFKIVPMKKLSNTIEEIRADLFVPKEYESALLSYIENSLLRNPDLEVVVSMEDMEKEIDSAINFSKEVIDLMKIRRHVLIEHIKYQNRETGSRYIKHMMKDLLMTITGKAANDKPNIIKENQIVRSYELDYNLCMEASMTELERTRVTERDIYLLQMDIDNIDDKLDKAYALNTIFDYIEIIEHENYTKIKRIGGDKVPEFIKNDKRLKLLHELKDKVLKIKVRKDNKFGVTINYPEGYEG